VKIFAPVEIGVEEKKLFFVRHAQARLPLEQRMQARGAALFYPGANKKILVKKLHYRQLVG
ncbi:MAG: hypothetical protein AAGL18_11835, partial [Pseudomonadota bacterium]